MLEYNLLKETFERNLFFKNKTWKTSPSPLILSPEMEQEIIRIGEACFDFLKSINKLYRACKNGKSILRNKQLILPWICDYFDRGKSESVVMLANIETFKNVIPRIIRPDLILTEEGLVMTELEVMPGGIGFTAFLHNLYEKEYKNLIGSGASMLEGFYNAMAEMLEHEELPVIAILVSDESEMYFPEFVWLAKELRRQGKRVYCINPNEVYYKDSKLRAPYEDGVIEIDVIYRFFELFDLGNIKTAEEIMQAIEELNVVASPPFNAIFEEKVCFGLFHHYQLEEYWKETLSRETFEILKKIIPATWVIDGEKFGPNAMLNGPQINGRCLRSWDELGEAGKKSRNLIIKRSGYHEDAWGARSVTVGSDCSQKVWARSIEFAIEESEKSPFIIQEFKKPKKIMHPIYDKEGKSVERGGRVRLCPYYMIGKKKVELKGILGTICPVDKKIIHGMSVGAFVPCKRAE